MITRNSYVLHFTTDQGKTESITVNNANPNLPPAIIFRAMDDIVAANSVRTDAGTVVSRGNALLIQRTTTEIS